MREIVRLALLVLLLLTSCTFSATEEARRTEFSELDFKDFKNTTWSQLTFHGIGIGARLEEIDRLSENPKLALKRDSNWIGISEVPDRDSGLGTGVSVFLRDRRVWYILLGSKTSRDEPEWPQRSYILRLKPDMRSFFENYDSTTREQLFASGQRFCNAETDRFREYTYDYRSMGFAFNTISFAKQGWKEELAQFYVYDPHGEIPLFGATSCRH